MKDPLSMPYPTPSVHTPQQLHEVQAYVKKQKDGKTPATSWVFWIDWSIRGWMVFFGQHCNIIISMKQGKLCTTDTGLNQLYLNDISAIAGWGNQRCFALEGSIAAYCSLAGTQLVEETPAERGQKL